MNRQALTDYILEQYNVVPNFPWLKYPNYAVFRHSNKKWFALVMDVPKNKLGLRADGNADIVNLKCDPALVASLLFKPGFFPAYHMNHENWITIILDGTVDDGNIRFLLEQSFVLTAAKSKKQ
jgi:predicted DNA-binding protein (MmcQ/YjbR family)